MLDFKTHKISSATGLMLDNLVYNRHGEVHGIRINDLHAFDHPDMGGNYGLYGIPLTEEWLIRMGFEIEKYPVYLTYKIWVGDFKLIYRVHNARKSTELWLEGNGAYDEYGEADLTDICKYVHSLQNIYFALTGKELTIK